MTRKKFSFFAIDFRLFAIYFLLNGENGEHFLTIFATMAKMANIFSPFSTFLPLFSAIFAIIFAIYYFPLIIDGDNPPVFLQITK